MTLPSLNQEKLEELKKLLAESLDLVENTVLVEFNAEGKMQVTAMKNGVVRQLEKEDDNT